MRKSPRLWITFSLIITIALVIGATFAYLYRHDLMRSLERATLPEAVEYANNQAAVSRQPRPVIQRPAVATSLPQASIAPQITTATPNLPPEINLAVPFTPQAPNANWNLPYKEFCEEASVLMAMRYINQQPITSPEDADGAMLAIKAFQEAQFGYYQDTDITDTATIFTNHFNYANVALLENPTAHDIRAALAAGKPVIMPAAGRLLGNPYFQSPGPLYHMLVIKGYTKDGRFITNDPGTRRGADFIYEEDVLMNALHDWRTDENILEGRKAILIVG